MSYRFKIGHVPGFTSSYVVLRREDGINLGTVASNAGRWIVKQSGERFFFATRDDAAQALDMADRASRPSPPEPTEKEKD